MAAAAGGLMSVPRALNSSSPYHALACSFWNGTPPAHIQVDRAADSQLVFPWQVTAIARWQQRAVVWRLCCSAGQRHSRHSGNPSCEQRSRPTVAGAAAAGCRCIHERRGPHARAAAEQRGCCCAACGLRRRWQRCRARPRWSQRQPTALLRWGTGWSGTAGRHGAREIRDAAHQAADGSL